MEKPSAQVADNSKIINQLREAGINPTQQRIEIAQILLAQPQHMSAEQVLSQVNREQPLVSKATVYNTLGLFASKGLLREVIVDPSKIFYDSNTSPHQHFYNVDTGLLKDIDSTTVQIQHLPSLPEGTMADGVDIIIRLRNRQ
ncbi:MAG: Fur family transcriptional regulator [Gammaproteobacteria bacterium]